MGLRGDWFKVATCAASTAIWIATCGRPDVADVKKLQRLPSPLPIGQRGGLRLGKAGGACQLSTKLISG